MSSTWHKVEMLNKYLLKLVMYDYPESLKKNTLIVFLEESRDVNEWYLFENYPLKKEKNIKLVLKGVSTAGNLAFWNGSSLGMFHSTVRSLSICLISSLSSKETDAIKLHSLYICDYWFLSFFLLS